MSKLRKATGHSYSYLQKQLRKFEIEKAKGNFGTASYGWDWIDHQFIENSAEQTVLAEILLLDQEGWGSKKISTELNRRNIPSKLGGRWSSWTVKKIIQRKGALRPRGRRRSKMESP